MSATIIIVSLLVVLSVAAFAAQLYCYFSYKEARRHGVRESAKGFSFAAASPRRH